MNERSDEILVKLSCKGDRQAYAELVKRYYRRIVGLCTAMVGDLHDAQDLAQETMLRGFESLERLQDGACFGKWIVQIARNLCLDHLRKRMRKKEIALTHEYIAESSADNQPDIRRAVRRLPMELRVPLLMYYFDGKNSSAISEQLSISPVTVCRRLRAAKERLSEYLTEQE